MELQYWQNADLAHHRAKMSLYLWAWGCYKGCPDSALDIACGPLGGVLPLLVRARRRVGVDPLCDEYRAAGILQADPGIEYVSAHFEEWNTEERFNAIFSADGLDHGELGFVLIPRLADMLNPGGRLYLHVNMRAPDQLNAIHDHALNLSDLDAALARTQLIELRRDIYPQDVDGAYDCPSLVGVWERPE